METQKKHGFTLVEMLVVLVIATLVVSLGYTATRNRMAAQAAETFIGLQSAEMLQFGAAAEEFAAQNSSTWAVNSRQTITPAQLRAVDLLPANWARRGGVDGATPIGETYRAIAIKDAQNRTRIVVADFGRSATDALVRRAGYQLTPDSLLGYKARVAERLVRDIGYPAAGYVAPGTALARGPVGSFEQSLAQFFPDEPTMPLAVALVGWPEYRRPGPQAPETGQGVSCHVANGVTRSCRAFNGTRVDCSYTPNVIAYWGPELPANASSVTRVPICPLGGGLTMLSPGPAGVALTFGNDTQIQDFLTEIPATCSEDGFATWGSRRGEIQQQIVQLNATTVFRETCSTSEPFYRPETYGCAIQYGGRWQNQHRVMQAAQRVVDGTTYNPLPNVPGSAFQQSPAERGHWFYCVPAN